MTTGQPTPALDRRLQTATVVVGAFSASVILFGVVGTLLIKPLDGGAPTGLTVPIVAAALFALVGSVMFRRVSFQPARVEQAYTSGGEASVADHLLRVTIVSAALSEAVGVLGLLLGLLTGDTYYFYVLCAVALLGVLCNLPRARRWREVVSEISMRDRAGAPSGTFGASQL